MSGVVSTRFEHGLGENNVNPREGAAVRETDVVVLMSE